MNLGRGEFHAGRSLDALLAAYRVGARLAWRRFVDAGTAAGLPPEAMYSLGEAIFAYIDEISAESAEGYAEEQSAAAGESQRRRRRLVRLLAQDPPPAQEAVRAAQAAAGRCRSARRAGGDSAALAAGGRRASGGEPVPGEEIVDAIATRLARRLGERRGRRRAPAPRMRLRARPGRTRPPRRRIEAARRRRRPARWSARPDGPVAARRRERPPRRRRVPRSPPPGASAGAAARGRRGPPGDAPAAAPTAASPRTSPRRGSRRSPTLADGPRARLTETLRAWLDRPGQVQAVAAELGVHPQTVRYRLRQLRELFGDAPGGSGRALRAGPRPSGGLTSRGRVRYSMCAMRLLVTGAAGMLGRDVVGRGGRRRP